MPPHVGGGPVYPPVYPTWGPVPGGPAVMPPIYEGGEAGQLPSLPPGTTKPTPPGGGASVEHPIFLPAPPSVPPENVIWPPLVEGGLPPAAGTKPLPPEVERGGGVYILGWIPGFGYRYIKVTLPPTKPGTTPPAQPKPA